MVEGAHYFSIPVDLSGKLGFVWVRAVTNLGRKMHICGALQEISAENN